MTPEDPFFDSLLRNRYRSLRNHWKISIGILQITDSIGCIIRIQLNMQEHTYKNVASLHICSRLSYLSVIIWIWTESQFRIKYEGKANKYQVKETSYRVWTQTAVYHGRNSLMQKSHPLCTI